jgi:hypothetical protein
VPSSDLLAHHSRCRPSPERYEKRYGTPLLGIFSHFASPFSPLISSGSLSQSDVPAASSPAPPRYKMAIILSVIGQWLNLLPTLERTLVIAPPDAPLPFLALP